MYFLSVVGSYLVEMVNTSIRLFEVWSYKYDQIYIYYWTYMLYQTYILVKSATRIQNQIYLPIHEYIVLHILSSHRNSRYILNKLGMHDSYNNWWQSCTKLAFQKYFTGQNITLDDWATGQGPHHSHGFIFANIFGTSAGNEDCAQIKPADHYRWHDYRCSGGSAYHHKYICEYSTLL